MDAAPARKRKADQSDPAPRPDQPHPVPAPDDARPNRPKRPRLSLTSPARKPTPPPRKRSSPRPKLPSPPPWSSMAGKTGYRLHLHRRPSLPPSNLLSPLAESPLTPNPGAVRPASLLPTITRDTLRELDLDAILRNPQLRHDLLFDPGLQFRPTTGRRKQLAAERYWAAVARELERGCTCTAWDTAGVLQACGCTAASSSESDSIPITTRDRAKRTRPPTPPPWSDRYTAYLEDAARLEEPHAHDPEDGPIAFTISVPSRVGPMLHELVAVLACVIIPPPLGSAVSALPPRPSPPSSDAQHLLTHLDPSLIEQELRRGIFDPAGLFGVIGDTLKRHCAPMRDQLVDAMIAAARGTEGTIMKRALRSIRMCFEILELMKLDIANHQLQHLRPFLTASTPDFELRIFVERCRRGLESPRYAREWLQRAWVQTRAKTTDDTPRRTRVQLSLINAITGLVFNPPPPAHTHIHSPHTGYPETLYLDTARVAFLAADAADLTALYMLIMLWRQLVFWKPAGGEEARDGEVFPRYTRVSARLEDWEVDRVKREIWEVGPRRIGSCFFFAAGGELPEDDRAKWTQAMQNVALQIAMRAEEARTRTSSGPSASAPATRPPPSQEALGLMNGWIQSHLRRDSALAGRLRELLRQEVADAVRRLTDGAQAVPGLGSGSAPVSGGGGGLEPLMPEIRHLAQRLAKLVLVNMRVYWSLYEAEGFLVDEA